MKSFFFAVLSLSLLPLSLLLPLNIYNIYISAFCALPFESPRHRRISTCQCSYSSLDRTSFRCAFVAPPSFIRVFVRAKRSEDEESFALADGGPSQSHRRRYPVFLSPPFFPTFLSPLMNAIALTTLSPFSPLAPFSLRLPFFSLSLVISVSNISSIPLLFLYFCSYRSSYATSFSLVYTVPFSTLFFLSHFMISVFLFLLYLHSSRKGQARISFSFLPFQH